MYADGAIIECACDSLSATGKEALRAYWEHRLKNYPASDLAAGSVYRRGAAADMA
jgi:hypothetical protein